MTDDSLIAAKAADGFKSESPIRAFTDFQVAGSYAIGKGFRPSLAHLTRYLDAMLAKEGWGVLQIILPRDSDGEPTILFERAIPADGLAGLLTTGSDAIGPFGADSILATPPVLLGDPINPRHYDGRECADLGERMSANAYQVLKYCWRLGKKDDPCVELGKALWYLKSEFDLVQLLPENTVSKPMLVGIADPQAFLEERIEAQSSFTQDIARMLWAGYDLRGIFPIRVAIEDHRNHLDCGRGLAI